MVVSSIWPEQCQLKTSSTVDNTNSQRESCKLTTCVLVSPAPSLSVSSHTSPPPESPLQASYWWNVPADAHNIRSLNRYFFHTSSDRQNSAVLRCRLTACRRVGGTSSSSTKMNIPLVQFQMQTSVRITDHCSSNLVLTLNNINNIYSLNCPSTTRDPIHMCIGSLIYHLIPQCLQKFLYCIYKCLSYVLHLCDRTINLSVYNTYHTHGQMYQFT